MGIDEIFENDDNPWALAKYRDTHLWVRMGADGLPQIIRVEPVLTDEGDLIPQSVVLTIDEAPPQIMDRWTADRMLSTANCVPLERMLHWKHKIKH